MLGISIMKKNLLFLFVMLIFVTLSAETETCRSGYCFDCYDSSRGLPQNSVVAFGRGEKNFMFIAGRNSFLRFDGRNFVSPLESAWKNLPSATLNGFVIAADGNSFLATDAGLWTFNLNKPEIKSVENIKEIGSNPVRSVAFDKKSNRLFGAVRGVGVFSFSNNSIEWFNLENSRLETDKVNDVFADKSGTIWLGASDGVYFLKKDEQKFHKVEYLDDSVSSFADFDGDSVFAGGKNGLYVIENGEVDRTFSPDEMQIPEITALKNGSDGKLWIGTNDSGIILFEGGFFEKLGQLPSGNLKTITAFAEDGEEEMWFGTRSGGFCIAKKSALRDFILKDETVENVVSDASGNILVNTLDSGIIRLSGDGEPEASQKNEARFSNVFVDSQNSLWTVSAGSGLYIMQADSTFKPVKEIFGSEEDIFPASASVFFEDFDGNVWTNDLERPSEVFVFMHDKTVERLVLPAAKAEIADILQNNGHLFIVTKRSGVFERKSDGTIQQVTLWDRDVFIKKVFADSKHRIWIITATDEIFISIETDAVRFPLAENLPATIFHSLTEDKNGNFWITTNAGVARFSGAAVDCLINGGCSSVPVSVYGKSRGLPFSECAEGQKSKPALSETGLLFVPMTGGLAVFDTNYEENFDYLPEARIEKIVVESEEKFSLSADLSGKIILPNSARSVTVFYSAAFFADSHELLFDYSFDNSHFTETTEGFATLSNLAGGVHSFTVRAYLANRRESFSEKTVSFEIPAEFYQKTAFKLTLPLIFVFISLVVFFMNKRLKVIRETEIRRMIDEKTAELQMKNNTLKEAVMKDPLTGLMNRRFLFDVEERKIRRFLDSRDRRNHLLDNRISEKNDIVYGVIMMDIDHFKRVNDIYGHDAGDSVLKGIAEIMQNSVRVDDILIRWGGEEFLIVLKNIPVSKIIEVAKKIRKAIETHPFEIKEGSTVWVTASMGVVFLPFFVTDPKMLTFENIITLADLALYNSKENGRDMATFVVPGKNVPKTDDEIDGMLGSGEFAAVNDFYTFEKIEPDNFSEFEV